MNEPREERSPARDLRASDGERERVAKLVGDAAGEGRLTLDEADERIARVYTAKFRHELAELTEDLPDAHEDGAARVRRWPPAAWPVRLRTHLAIAVVMSVFLILRWVASDAPFFWPAGPMFFLFGSLALHARLVLGSSRGRTTRPRELGPASIWRTPAMGRGREHG